MARKTIDLLGLGLIIQAVFIILLVWNFEDLLIKLMGIIGSIIIILVEIIFLYEKWFKNGQ